MAMLKDLNFHAFEFSDATGQFTLGVVLTMLQGKMNADGKLLYGVVVRNKDVEVCPVGSLALYLFELFMDPRVRPDFTKPDWVSNYLVFASSPDQPMSSTAHYINAQRQEMLAANIVSPRVTHVGRRAGASIEEIAEHGNWLHQRAANHYLREIPERIPLKLAGFVDHQERYWLARNTLIPPVELQRLIFPEINHAYPGEDWQTWMDNIITDKEEYNNRQMEQRLDAKYPQDEFQKIKFFTLLARLRKVILQDAVALMETTSDPQCQYHFHRLFQEPVFKSPLFAQFRDGLRKRMSTATSPISDNLLVNTPAIQHCLRDITEKMADVSETLRGMPSAADMRRDEELWLLSIERQIDRMRNDLVAMHNGLTSVNNTAISNMAKLRTAMAEFFTRASEMLASVEIRASDILLLPVPRYEPYDPPQLPSSTSERQPRSPSPAVLSPASLPSTSLPPASPPSASLPPASPLSTSLPPASPLSTSLPPASPSASLPPTSPHSFPSRATPPPASPPPTSSQTSTQIAPERAITFPATTDLDALAEEFAWPRDKPTSTTYTMRLALAHLNHSGVNGFMGLLENPRFGR